MTQDGEEVNVKVKVTADNSGADKAEKAVKRVGTAAKKTAAESKSDFEQMRAGVGKVQGAFGALRKVLTGFGALAFASSIIGGLKKIRDSFSEATEEAKKFAEAEEKAAQKKAIEDLAEAYDVLAKSIAAAASEREHNNEIADIELKNVRDLEDANIDLAEQKALDAVNPNDETAEEQRTAIRAFYQGQRNELAADRKREDLERSQDRLRDSAEDQRSDAERLEDSAERDSDLIADLTEKRNKALARSVSENKYDNHGFMDHLASNLHNFVTLNWGKIGDTRTDEGNAEREKAGAEAKEFQAAIDDVAKRKANKLDQAKVMRTNADRDDRKADAINGAIRANDVRWQATGIGDARGQSAADAALRAKEQASEAEERQYADSKKASALLAVQKQNLQEQIAAEQKKKDAAAFQVYQAQGAMDTARLGGNRADQQSALANLQAAQNAAQNVNHAADQTINALNATLTAVEKKLQDFTRTIQKHEKKNANFRAEAPAGK